MYVRNSGSTSPKVKSATLKTAPPPQPAQRAEGARLAVAVPDHRREYVVTIKWLRGCEPWFEVTCGAERFVWPAHKTLLDLTLRLTGYHERQ